MSIICNSKQSSFFVFYFNVPNKISSTPPRLLNVQFSTPHLSPPPPPPAPFYIDFCFFYFRPFLQVLSKNQFGILVLPDQSPSILVAETWSQWFSLSFFKKSICVSLRMQKKLAFKKHSLGHLFSKHLFQRKQPYSGSKNNRVLTTNFYEK